MDTAGVPQDNMQTNTTSTTSQFGESDYGERLDYTKPKYQDLWAGVCFYIHVILIIVVAVYFWAVVLPEELDDVTPSPTSVANDEDDEDTTGIWITLIVALIAGACFGLLWLQCIKMFANVIIKVMLFVMIGCYTVMAVFGLLVGNVMLVIFGVLLALISVLYTYWYAFFA